MTLVSDAIRQNRKVLLVGAVVCWLVGVVMYLAGIRFPGQLGLQLVFLVAAGLLWTADEGT